MPAVAAPVHARVGQARRRLLLAAALEWLGRALLVAASAMLAAGSLRWLAGQAPVDGWLLGAGAAGFALIFAWGLARAHPSTNGAAAILDLRAGSCDRFSTALAFEQDPADAWKAEAVRECAAYAERVDPVRLLPVRAPWFATYALAPLVALLCLQIFFEAEAAARRPPAAETQAVNETADSLRQLAQLAAKAAAEQRDEALARAAELLQQRAARLQERAAKDRDAAQLAQREMSTLAEMLRELREQASRPQASADELAALAEALSRQDSTRSAAESIRSGDAAGAGKQLEDLLRKMKERGDAARQMEDIARSMQEPAGRLTEQQKSEIARQMQQAAQAAQAGRSERMQQLLQRLAELLKQQRGQGKGQQQQQQGGSQQQAGGRGEAKPLTEKALEQLIKALEQMKQGGSPMDALGNAQRGFARLPAPGPGPGGKQPGADGPDNPDGLPTGNAGSELDRGTGKKLFADQRMELKADGAASKLEGALGDGASLQEFMTAPGGAGQALRKYRELYEAMAPAAQDALEQENIPIGSRKTVRRYFESIRPRE